MSTMQYNSKDGAVRRIMQEIKEMSRDHNPFYKAAPLEENLFEWHFTIRGQSDTDFAGGIYHGRIVLPARYPLAPPHIYFLTVRVDEQAYSSNHWSLAHTSRSAAQWSLPSRREDLPLDLGLPSRAVAACVEQYVPSSLEGCSNSSSHSHIADR